jgi:hypothetical protein
MMRTHEFGKRSGFDVPNVSIGAMRLPADVDDAIQLIRHAIDHGLRYIDTSRGYGESEWILGRALKDGYREKVILSTKWSPWIKPLRPDDDASADSVRRRIEESMRRLDVEYLDFYQIWNINSREAHDKAVAPGGFVDGIRKAREEGLVGHIGFTSHDSVENLIEYIAQDDWIEILLVTYNFLNAKYAPVLKAAHEAGIGTVTMNPVGGGRLTEESEILMGLAREVGAESVPEMAIRYVLSNSDIDTMLCGMSKISDVDHSIASVERGPFDVGQLAKIDEFIAARSRENVGFCTACKYCLPCPQGIAIPAIMGAIYEERYLGLVERAQRIYDKAGEKKADACVKCGACEPKCTQHLPIMQEMEYASRKFGPKKD